MIISTAAWHWPQWAMLVWLLIAFTLNTAYHGKPRVDKNGDPEKHNGFAMIGRLAVLMFFLICGGFFA